MTKFISWAEWLSERHEDARWKRIRNTPETWWMFLVWKLLHPRSSNLLCFTENTSSDVYVVPVASMYFKIRNDSSCGTYSLTLGTDEFSCDRRELMFRFLIMMGWLFLKWDWRMLLIWFSLTNFLFFSSFRTVMFPDAVLCQRFWLFHLRPGSWSFHFFAAIQLLGHRAFWRGF